MNNRITTLVCRGTELRRFPFSSLVLCTQALFLVLVLISGCGDEDPYIPSFGPPGEGHIAVLELTHRLAEGSRTPFTFARVDVTINDQDVIGASVLVDNAGIPYSQQNGAYAAQISPSLFPTGQYLLRVQSQTWGEDSIYVRLPGLYTLQGWPADNRLIASDTLKLRWDVPSYTDCYKISVGEVTASGTSWQRFSQDSTTFDIEVPGHGIDSLLVLIDAVSDLPEDQVFSGAGVCRWMKRAPVLSVTGNAGEE